MSVLSGLVSFTAGTKAKASEVNTNFTAVKNFVESLSTGVNIDAGAITNVKLGADVYNFYAPVGGIMQYAGSSTPAGGKWLICDGSLVSRTTYAALFTAIGVSYGAGDGSTTFALPNLKGRVPIGLDATQTEFDVLGETGGSKASSANHTHAFSATSSPMSANSSLSHNITDTGHSHTINGSSMLGGLDSPMGVLQDQSGLGYPSYTESTSTSATGISISAHDVSHTHSVSGTAAASGDGSNNLQPYIVVNYIIRVA